MAFKALEDALRTLRNRVGTVEAANSSLTTEVEVLAGAVSPTAAVTAFAGATAPTGWLLCNGSAVSRTTYAALFEVIGTTYGAGNGSTTFNLPDLRGRVPVGRDSGQTEFDVLGEAGGAKTHTLSVNEIPSHNHVSGETARAILTNTSQRTASTGTQGAFISTTENIVPAGGDQPHNNLQPYRVLNFIIKA